MTHLIDAGYACQQGSFRRELLKALFIELNGSEWLVKSDIHFTQIQHCVHHVLLVEGRPELSLCIPVHS